MRKRAGTERLAKIPLFASLSTRQLAEVDALVTMLDVKAGSELIHEGTRGHEFFLVIDGEAEVRHGDKVIARRGPGTFFGETALLLDQPRNASVFAVSDLSVEVISQQDFRQLLKQQPDLYAPLLDATARQLADLETDG